MYLGWSIIQIYSVHKIKETGYLQQIFVNSKNTSIRRIFLGTTSKYLIVWWFRRIPLTDFWLHRNNFRNLGVKRPEWLVLLLWHVFPRVWAPCIYVLLCPRNEIFFVKSISRKFLFFSWNWFLISNKNKS